jgi:uncharacterized protein (UPF0276 family)
MLGIGFRQEMRDWSFKGFDHDFIEVIPENWLRRNPQPLIEHGKSICFHGISLNLGGNSPIDQGFLKDVRQYMQSLGISRYSDHLAASGDAHQLYDLFPIPFTPKEASRVADRIKSVQDFLGFQIAVENSVYYTNTGEMKELDFLNLVATQADCLILLDVNNLVVNQKNHHVDIDTDLINWDRVTYVHIAGHIYQPQFDLYWDTHSQRPEKQVVDLANLARKKGKSILLEWDNQIPSEKNYLKELKWLQQSFGTTSEA